MKQGKRDDGFRMSDVLWQQIEPLLPAPKPHPLGCHRPRVPNRAAMNAIRLVLRTGMQWSALDDTGVCTCPSAYRRFREWVDAGVFATFWRLGLLEYDELKGIVKTPESQAVLALHRIRDGFIKARTAQANQLRGLLAEFGLAIPVGMARLVQLVNGIIADPVSNLPLLMRRLTQQLLSHLLKLDRQVKEIDQQVQQLARQSSVCRQLERIPGIGPITATALEATVADNIKTFRNGRHLAAFLGLVPKQHSSGGKERLQGIGKRGDGYLHRLLAMGPDRYCTMPRANRNAVVTGWHS